jgi:hypothetical protein
MRLHKAIEITASIERVFEFIDDPGNYSALRPEIVRVLGMQWLPHGGREVRYLTRDDWDDGLSVECMSRDIEYDPRPAGWSARRLPQVGQKALGGDYPRLED